MFKIIVNKLKFQIFAVCLDGSPPAYNFDKGYGTGINSWLVHMEVCSFLQIAINNKTWKVLFY